jgi:hypothetical protein
MVENKIETLLDETLFVPDEKSREFLQGTISVRDDSSNPIREILAACGLREYVKHFLNAVSPDEELKNCDWCQVEKDFKLLDRLRYFISGGLSEDFLKKHLNFDLELYKKNGDFMDAHDNLSKLLHSSDSDTIKAFDSTSRRHCLPVSSSDSDNTETFASLEQKIVGSLRKIQSIHNQITQSLEAEIHEFASELINDIDFSNISTGMMARYCLENSFLEEVKLEIKSETLVLHLSGTVEGSLEFSHYEPTDPYMPQSWTYTARFTLNLNDLYTCLDNNQSNNVSDLIIFQAPGDPEFSWLHDGDFLNVQFPTPDYD